MGKANRKKNKKRNRRNRGGGKSKQVMKATPQQPQTANTSLVKVSLGKLLDTEFVKRKPLLSPWLRQGESALVYAEAGVGKSMFVMSMALAIAGGGKFLDWECTEPRKVLFWDGEMFQDDIKERANALMPTIEGLNENVANDNLDSVVTRYLPTMRYIEFGLRQEMMPHSLRSE